MSCRCRLLIATGGAGNCQLSIHLRQRWRGRGRLIPLAICAFVDGDTTLGRQRHRIFQMSVPGYVNRRGGGGDSVPRRRAGEARGHSSPDRLLYLAECRCKEGGALIEHRPLIPLAGLVRYGLRATFLACNRAQSEQTKSEQRNRSRLWHSC